jgi:hypothetical protein
MLVREPAPIGSNFDLWTAVDTWTPYDRPVGMECALRRDLTMQVPAVVSQTLTDDYAWSRLGVHSYDGNMPDEPIASHFSRPPAPLRTFTVASPPRPMAPKPLGPIEVGENLPMGFMAGLVAAAVGAALWALITILTGVQIGWMAVGVGFLVGWAIRVAGRGRHSVFGIMGALLALGGCAVGNLLAIVVIAARHFNVALLEVFTHLTPDVVTSLMEQTFKPMDVLFYGLALLEGYRFSIVGRA